jgi:excisionase family DNA binding protein
VIGGVTYAKVVPSVRPQAERSRRMSGFLFKLETAEGAPAEPPSFSAAVTTRTVPRVALTRAEAAAVLGVSLDSFERHIQGELRLVRRGRLRLVPLRELERWLDANAARVLE